MPLIGGPCGTVNDQSLMNEIQYHLLETPNNGASFGTGLYTVAEVIGRLNYRANVFNKLTGSYVLNTAQVATSGQKSQDLSTSSQFQDLLAVFWSGDAGTTFTNIPKGSSVEGDEYITSQAPVATPSFYTLDSAPVLNINFFPAPTFTGSNGQIKYIYAATLGTLTNPPSGSTLNIPNEFSPFIKYGALADLFGKSGETYDPARAAVCEMLFQLGVETAKDWLTGSQM